jgi:hypothetical protein
VRFLLKITYDDRRYRALYWVGALGALTVGARFGAAVSTGETTGALTAGSTDPIRPILTQHPPPIPSRRLLFGAIWSWLLRGSIRPLRTRRRASHSWSTGRFPNRTALLPRPYNAYRIVPHYPSADTVGRDSGALQRSAASSPKSSPRGRCNGGASDRL